ncbi:MAG: hypothetical protein JSV59_11160 [Flavobacteriaceae bacterium]|nr:MAG: hypothetical protein JSV59_11160 [Flavobacteriaceae bacterium]
MINFFRRIRKKLADDNKPLKYMRYAIGEILLVVIGILIALQINNWNEEQKEYILEREYLKGIKDDLAQDVVQATAIVNSITPKLNIIKFLEPGFNLSPSYKTKNIDTTSIDFINLFERNVSFRSTRGSYSSLIADGKANLTKNRILFQKIQRIYDELYPRIYSLYGDFKLRENSLSTTYSYEKFHWDYNSIQKAGNEKIIADLANFWDLAHFYCIFLDDSIVEVKNLINDIELEIEK